MFFRYLFIFSALLLSLAPQAVARDFTPTSQVVDYTGVLDYATVERLKSQVENVEYVSGRQVVILIVPSLQGRTPQNYAQWIVAQWGIGQKTKGGGLLLVARDEKRAWVETVGMMEPLNNSAKKAIVSIVEAALKKGSIQSAVNEGGKQVIMTLTNKTPVPYIGTSNKEWLQVAGLAFVIFLRLYFFGFRRRSLLGHVTDSILGGARRRW